jgi:hypothetical protein
MLLRPTKAFEALHQESDGIIAIAVRGVQMFLVKTLFRFMLMKERNPQAFLLPIRLIAYFIGAYPAV